MSEPNEEDFCDVLRQLRHGGSVANLTKELRDLVSAVRETGRRGKLVLTIDVKPASTGDATALTLADAVKVTYPTSEKVETLFFADVQNVLKRNDPRQPELSGLRRPEDPQRKEVART